MIDDPSRSRTSSIGSVEKPISLFPSRGSIVRARDGFDAGTWFFILFLLIETTNNKTHVLSFAGVVALGHIQTEFPRAVRTRVYGRVVYFLRVKGKEKLKKKT